MPADWLGVLLCVTLPLPGFVHRETRRTIRPVAGDRSTFEQTVEVIAVSVVVNVVAGMALVLARLNSRVAAHTPDLAAIVGDFHNYVWADPRRTAYIAAWFVVHLAVCAALAFGLAHAAASETWVGRRARSITGPIRAEPAWHRAFEGLRISDATVWVGCTLDDGSHVSGLLEWYSTDVDETPDRELVLSRPVVNAEPLDVHHTIVSARRMARIDVAYLTDGAVRDLIAEHEADG